jgi:hypothetical protein
MEMTALDWIGLDLIGLQTVLSIFIFPVTEIQSIAFNFTTVDDLLNSRLSSSVITCCSTAVCLPL